VGRPAPLPHDGGEEAVTPLERFMRKVYPVEGCWLWCASTLRGGYGQFNDGRTMVRAHRWIYEQLVGPIPEGLDLDHLCRVRNCVNPEHLEPVTRGENLLRGYAARGVKTHCAKGHPFDSANTFKRPSGGRGCRTCRNNASRASKAKARADKSTTQPNTIGATTA
jgi:hypothetical protein